MELPPIVILMPDQFRADCLGCAGHPVIRTPNIDRIAAEGVRFTRCFTPSPLCMPARASFISGRYPHNHGIWKNAGQLPAGDETFFQHLQEAGYFTAHIGKSHYHPQRRDHLRDHEAYMQARGFHFVHETTGPWATVGTESYLTDHWRERGLLDLFRQDYAKRREAGPCTVWPSPLPVEEHLDSYIGRQAVEFLRAYEDTRPLCLFVGFGGPHEPWDPPGEYATLYDPAAMPPPLPAAEPAEDISRYAAERMLEGRIPGIAEEDVRRIRASYYGKATLVDHWVGEILDALAERGWLEEAFLIFWSDHGEMAGDHGRLHKQVFYESAVRVPLLCRWKGRIAAGETRDALVELIDLAPTLLEGVGAPAARTSLGRSLWDVLRDPTASHRDAVLSEVVAAGHRNVMVRTEQWKYAMDETGEGFLLHDLAADADEQRNLAGHPHFAEVERQLRNRLLRFFLEAQVVQGGD